MIRTLSCLYLVLIIKFNSCSWTITSRRLLTLLHELKILRVWTHIIVKMSYSRVIFIFIWWYCSTLWEYFDRTSWVIATCVYAILTSGLRSLTTPFLFSCQLWFLCLLLFQYYSMLLWIVSLSLLWYQRLITG